MAEAVRLRNNAYYDSATLMSISQRIKRQEGVREAVAVMGTDHNKQLLEDVGLSSSVAGEATARDLILAVQADTNEVAEQAIDEIEGSLSDQGRQASKRGEFVPTSLLDAFEEDPGINLVLISVPGEYASREAETALDAGKHVMMFSSNVPLDAEIRLKKKANDKGLFMMGPDCGTAIINGVPLAFANVVDKGPIGVVAAAGTGLQETTSLIDRYGSGITQGIGTGGRDVKDEVGGLMFLTSFEALLADEETKVILLVSKPTGPKVLKGVSERIRAANKPVIVAMLGGGREEVEDAGGIFAENLEQGARRSVEAAGKKPPVTRTKADLQDEAGGAATSIGSGRRYLRALYTGGTLCYEALLMLAEDYPLKTNVPLEEEQRIDNPFVSEGHCAIDLGEDEFTEGRPHPMMEPSLRTERINQEAEDPETAILLLDFVLGHGSHEDPVGDAADALREASGNGICVVASVTGTRRDPQNFDSQVEKLRSTGAHVFDSNAEAVGFVSFVLAALKKGASK